MSRLSWTGWLGIVGIVVIGTLYLMPATGWLVKTNIRSAVGDLDQNRERGMNTVMDMMFYSTGSLLKPYLKDTPKTSRESLVQALSEDEFDKRREALFKLSAKYPHDALTQAALCRYATQFSMQDPTTTTTKPPSGVEDTMAKYRAETMRLVEMAQQGAKRGEKCDPQNAHFPLVLASTYLKQHKLKEAIKAYDRASSCGDYNDYSREECQLLEDALTRHGITGYSPRLGVNLSIVYPYFAGQKAVVNTAIRIGDEKQQIRTRLQTIRICEVIRNRSNTLIGGLVAVACAKIAIYPELYQSNDQASFDRAQAVEWQVFVERTRQLQLRARKLGADIKGFDAVKSMEENQRITQATKAYASQWPDKSPAFPDKLIPRSSNFLIVMVLLVPLVLFFALGQRLRQHEGASLALPILPALYMAILNRTDLWMTLTIVYLVVSFAIAWIPRYQKWVPWIIGASVCLGGLSFLLATPPDVETTKIPVWVISIVLVVTWGVSRLKSWVSVCWLVAISQIAVLTVIAMMGILDHRRLGTDSSFFVLGVLAVLVAAVTFGPRLKIPVVRLIGPLVLAGSILFAGFIRQELKLDRELKPILITYTEEASRVREQALQLKLDD
jgi:hypothetical protein